MGLYWLIKMGFRVTRLNKIKFRKQIALYKQVWASLYEPNKSLFTKLHRYFDFVSFLQIKILCLNKFAFRHFLRH